ncbi:MAG: type II secretion system protein GspD [bacterium]
MTKFNNYSVFVFLCLFFVNSALLTAQEINQNQQQQKKPYSINYSRGVFEVKMEGDLLEDVLKEIEHTGDVEIKIIGDAKIPLTMSVKEKSLAMLIRLLSWRANFLCVQRQNHFTIYAQGAEQILAEKNVTYEFKLRCIPVETALQQLQPFIGRVTANGIKEHSSIAITGPLEAVKETISFLEIIDDESPVVLIELLVVQYRHGYNYNWGIDVSKGTFERISDLSYAPGSITSSSLEFAYNFIGHLDPTFTFNLTNLVQDNKAKVITNPHLAVRNGETAQLQLTEEKNVILSSSSVYGTTYNLQKLSVGVMLNITPTVTIDRWILLDVQGEVSVFVPSTSQSEYSIDRNTISTRINVKDDQTLIIGGLIKEEQVQGESGVPLLKSIPLLGNLFKQKSKERAYFETVLYITPHIYPLESYEELRERTEVIKRLKDMEEQDKIMQKQQK